MRVITEGFHMVLHVFVQNSVMRYVKLPCSQLLYRWQLAEKKQVGRFEMRAVFGKLLDRIAPIAQNPLITVDEGDRALRRGRVGKRRIIGHETEIVGIGLDLPQVE